MTAPDVSVVIVAYNSGDDVARGIRSLRAETRGVSFEIIVADNASDDDAGASVAEEFPDVRVLHLPRNRGLSAGINAGVAAACGEFVLQWNPDCRLPAGHDALAVLVAWLRAHPATGVAAPRLLNDDGSLQLSCRAFPGYATALFGRYSLLTRLWPSNRFSRRYLMTDFDHGSAVDVDWASGAALMYPRALHERLGGWDEAFFLFSEDVDFCRRVQDAGLRVKYVPEARILHTIGISKRPPLRALVERHRSMWRYYRKHVRRSFVQDLYTGPVIGLRLAAALAGRLFASLRRKDALP